MNASEINIKRPDVRNTVETVKDIDTSFLYTGNSMSDQMAPF